MGAAARFDGVWVTAGTGPAGGGELSARPGVAALPNPAAPWLKICEAVGVCGLSRTRKARLQYLEYVSWVIGVGAGGGRPFHLDGRLHPRGKKT